MELPIAWELPPWGYVLAAFTLGFLIGMLTC